jgi:4-carboxymuconolactone decarboxylase
VADERKAIAVEETRRLFGVDIDLGPREGEPAAAGDLRRILHEHAFTDSWSRSALDDRSRSLATVAICAALGLEKELRMHVGGALTIGLTPEELIDLFLHVGVYAGVARGMGAWNATGDVISKAAGRRDRDAGAQQADS